MSRLPQHFLDMADRDAVQERAGQIVIDAVREAGLDPARAVNNPMLRALVNTWGRGEMDRAKFIHCCRNLAILNPGLKL